MLGYRPLRDAIGKILDEELLRGVGDREREALDVLLEGLIERGALTRADALELEKADGAVTAVMSEAAFLAGLECGADMRRLVCK
jgi:hypothetical protein